MERKQNNSWRSVIAFLVLMLFNMMIPMVSFGDAGVESFWNTAYETDYYVKVSASDGGANLRNGAGVKYNTIISGMMPNGTVLHITQVAVADNGKKWGLTEYQGSQGWVALSQTTSAETPFKENSSDGSESTTDVGNTINDDDSVRTLVTAATEVDYSVRVAAPDGGVNFRYGPGTSYAKIISHMISNGTQLHIRGEGKASNGKTWGLTEYNGQLGWIFLGQTEKVTSGSYQQTQTAEPAQTAQPDQIGIEEDVSNNRENEELPSTEQKDDSKLSGFTDDGTLVISTNSLLKAAMVIIALLIILLFLTIIFFTRKKNKPTMEKSGREMGNGGRDRRDGFYHDSTFNGRDYRDPWNR